jgi:methylmalonyl-CoA mutase
MQTEKLFTEFSPASDADWEKQIISDLKGAEYNKVLWNTGEGFEINPFYTINHEKGSNPLFTHTTWDNIQTVSNSDVAKKALENAADGLKYIGNNSSELKKILALSGSAKVIVNDAALVEFPQKNIWILTEINQIEKLSYLLQRDYRVMVYSENKNGVVNKLSDLLLGLNRLAESIGIEKFENLSVSYTVEKNYFLEISALRALRVLWFNLLKNYESEADLQLHAEALIYDEDEKEPYKNMLSNTTEAMSAIIGGCNSLCITPHDCKIDDDFSARIARNVSTILKEESYLDKISDVGAGSYFIEHTTKKIAEEVWKRC